jgi:hypothetical protein
MHGPVVRFPLRLNKKQCTTFYLTCCDLKRKQMHSVKDAKALISLNVTHIILCYTMPPPTRAGYKIPSGLCSYKIINHNFHFKLIPLFNIKSRVIEGEIKQVQSTPYIKHKHCDFKARLQINKLMRLLFKMDNAYSTLNLKSQNKRFSINYRLKRVCAF